MSKDQELVKVKRDTKSLVMKNLIVMAVLIIIALTGVISWFTNKTKAEADGINVTCEAPDSLEIAVVRHGANPPSDEDYTNEGKVDLTDTVKYPFLKQLSMEEITSDGRYFYKPKITQDSNGAFVDTTSSEPWANAENAYTTDFSVNSSLSYLSVDVYMRSKGSHKVTLASSTSVTPQHKDKLTGNAEDIANKSDMGAFSKNCIVGAVRVSTVVENQCKNLWIPAPNIIYTETKSGNIITRTVHTDLKNTQSEFGTFVHKYWQVDHSTSKRIGTETMAAENVITNDKGDYTLGANKDLLTLSKDESDESIYYTGMVTLNLWIDGEDAEARQALVGGKFSADFKFGLN